MIAYFLLEVEKGERLDQAAARARARWDALHNDRPATHVFVSSKQVISGTWDGLTVCLDKHIQTGTVGVGVWEEQHAKKTSV